MITFPPNSFFLKQIHKNARNVVLLPITGLAVFGFLALLGWLEGGSLGKFWFYFSGSISIICLFFIVKILFQLVKLEYHPLIKEISKYGSLDRLLPQLELEIQKVEMSFGRILMTPSWLVHVGLLQTNVVPLAEIVWMYGKVESYQYGKSYCVVLYSRSKRLFQAITNENQMPEILEALSRKVPWAASGYGPQLIRMWKSNRAEFIKQIDKRKADIQLGSSDHFIEMPADSISGQVPTMNSGSASSRKQNRTVRKILWAAYVVIAPLAISGLLTLTHRHLEKRVGEAIVKDYVTHGDAAPVLQDGFLNRMCKDPKVSNENYCVDNSRILLSRKILLWNAVVGVALFIFIFLIALIGKKSRDWLVFAFGIGIYVSLIAGAGLMLANGLVLTYTAYIAEVVFADIAHPEAILLVGLIFLIGAFNLIKPAFQMTQRARSFVIGKTLTDTEYPSMWAFVRDAASRLNSLIPDNIIVGLGTQFYVTEVDATCMRDKLKGRTLFLSLPLMHQLSKAELLAIVGHELGHFRGSDTVYTQKFYPIYKSAYEGLESLKLEDGTPKIFALPVYALFAHFMDEFSVIEKKVGRERELLADRAASELTSDAIASSALAKIYAYSGLWSTVENKIFYLVKQGRMLKNCSQFYSEHLNSLTQGQLLQIMNEERKIPHPTDTHPPLDVRLKQLGANVTDGLFLLEPKGDNSTSLLGDNFERIELELNQIEHDRAAHMLNLKKGQKKGSEKRVSSDP